MKVKHDMYAQLDKRMWPPGWEEAEWYAKKLQQVSWNYQVVVERKMFAGLQGPDYKFVIVRYGLRPDINTPAPRTVVWEGFDFTEFVGMLKLLCASEQAAAQEQQGQL